MLGVALLLAVPSAVVTIAMGVSAGHVGSGASLWRNLIVLLPSILAVAGGITCLKYPKATTYLLGTAVLIFGLSENWIALALGVAAGGIEFYFGRARGA
jgi:hypothetical protein